MCTCVRVCGMLANEPFVEGEIFDMAIDPHRNENSNFAVMATYFQFLRKRVDRARKIGSSNDDDDDDDAERSTRPDVTATGGGEKEREGKGSSESEGRIEKEE